MESLELNPFLMLASHFREILPFTMISIRFHVGKSHSSAKAAAFIQVSAKKMHNCKHTFRVSNRKLADIASLLILYTISINRMLTMEQLPFDSSDTEEKDRLVWRNRELTLRTKVLKTQLENALKTRQAGAQLSKATVESTESIEDDNQHQLLRLDLVSSYQSRQESLIQLKKKLEFARQKILTRTRAMLRQLWDVYPIVEFPDGRGYSICDIHLPHSESFEGHDETMVSVAIGYVGHLLLLLSDLLDITLRFPLKFYGSKSLIYCNRKSQLFPLFIESFKSREWVNFSYGMTLLNLDIVQIRTTYGLNTTDPEETLANLHGLKQTLDRND